jgi:hypothetical protein
MGGVLGIELMTLWNAKHEIISELHPSPSNKIFSRGKLQIVVPLRAIFPLLDKGPCISILHWALKIT